MTKVNRTKLAAELEDLARDHRERLAPLQADLAAAEAAHAGAVEALKATINAARSAQISRTAETRRHDRARAAIEAELREDAAARLNEFRIFCTRQKDAMRDRQHAVKGDELRAMQARSQVALDAIRALPELGLLPDDALNERLAELRAEISEDESPAREAVASS